MQFQFQDNGERGEFYQVDASGKRIAEIQFIWQDERVIIAEHTWVDDSLKGQGVARALLNALVEFARAKHLKIVAKCSYVEVMFQRDLSLADVAA